MFTISVTCLPLCYPCYLSRTIRRRRKKHLFISQEYNLDIQDDLNQTMQRQVTRVSTIRDSKSPKNAGNEVKINVNVIRLHSPASKALNQYFQLSEPSNNVSALCSRNYENVKLRPTVWKFNSNMYLPILHTYVSSILAKFQSQKLLFFIILESLKVEFW